MNNSGEKVNFIWKIAELLRGPYKAERYGALFIMAGVSQLLDRPNRKTDGLGAHPLYRLSYRRRRAFLKRLRLDAEIHV